MSSVSIRYIVDDVDAAIAFYCDGLGFDEVMHPAPSFAMLSRGDLRLVLSAPGGGPGGGQAMPDGTLPSPGGWNRFSVEVDDLDGQVERLRAAGARFRNEVVTGVGGRQVLVEDPSGNPVELFEPTRDEARLASSADEQYAVRPIGHVESVPHGRLGRAAAGTPRRPLGVDRAPAKPAGRDPRPRGRRGALRAHLAAPRAARRAGLPSGRRPGRTRARGVQHPLAVATQPDRAASGDGRGGRTRATPRGAARGGRRDTRRRPQADAADRPSLTGSDASSADRGPRHLGCRGPRRVRQGMPRRLRSPRRAGGPPRSPSSTAPTTSPARPRLAPTA